MRTIKIAIAVQIFPNLFQTYILNQLVAFSKMKLNFSIFAIHKKTYDFLPTDFDENKLLDKVVYVNASFKNFYRELFSLPVLSCTYWKIVSKILTLNDSIYTTSYRIKSLLRTRVLVTHPFDIIHSHSLFSSYYYLFLKDISSIPIVTTYHGQLPIGVTKLPAKQMAMVFDRADAFIVNTNYAKKALSQLGCSAEKINIIPQGTNLDNFPFKKRSITPKSTIKLLTVGRLSSEKGHFITIKALVELLKKNTNIEYHLVGHGPEKNNLFQLCKKYQLTNKIIFHGFKTGDELLRLYSSCHIFILPSLTVGNSYLAETQGVVLQEAQATGLPVIGSRTGGIPDVIVENKTGLLFNEGDHHDLAVKIESMIADANLYEMLCQQGRLDVEKNYDINVICKRILSLYSRLLN